MFDYHMHTAFSFDARSAPAEMYAAAKQRGLREICFTDHVDLDGSGFPPADLRGLANAVRTLAETGASVRFGAEVSLADEACAQASAAYLDGLPLDFVIGSVHLMDGVDPYEQKEIFQQPKEIVYKKYLECIDSAIRSGFPFSVLGHYDYIAKCAVYEDRSFSLEIAPDIFDRIFDFLVANGKGLEVNTASWKDDPSWGLDILRRYRQRGGQFVTIGSDAHTPERVGNRLDEAIQLVRAAGIPYLATFRAMQPVFTRI